MKHFACAAGHNPLAEPALGAPHCALQWPVVITLSVTVTERCWSPQSGGHGDPQLSSPTLWSPQSCWLSSRLRTISSWPAYADWSCSPCPSCVWQCSLGLVFPSPSQLLSEAIWPAVPQMFPLVLEVRSESCSLWVLWSISSPQPFTVPVNLRHILSPLGWPCWQEGPVCSGP